MAILSSSIRACFIIMSCRSCESHRKYWQLENGLKLSHRSVLEIAHFAENQKLIHSFNARLHFLAQVPSTSRAGQSISVSVSLHEFMSRCDCYPFFGRLSLRLAEGVVKIDKQMHAMMHESFLKLPPNVIGDIIDHFKGDYCYQRKLSLRYMYILNSNQK